MTENILTGDCDTYNLEKILARFVDSNGICIQCGHSHRFVPRFDGVRTSIDALSELLQATEKIRCAPSNDRRCK